MFAHAVDMEVVGWGRAHGSAHAEVVHYHFVQRLVRALRAVAVVWLVAVPLMFVPWLFILVIPSAIGLSAFLFLMRVRAPEVALSCIGTCPDCGQTQRFEMPMRFELPLHIECSVCNRELTLEDMSAS